MKTIINSLLILFCCEVAAAKITLSGVNVFDTTMTYINESVVLEKNSVVLFDEGLSLLNSTMYVKGFMEVRGNLNMVNSRIFGYDTFKVAPNTNITEYGPSYICIKKDPNQLPNSSPDPKLLFEGGISNPITVYSDYPPLNQPDTAFLILLSGASESVIESTDFFGGWCNIFTDRLKLEKPISDCRFFGSDYPLYICGKRTDIRNCLFSNNLIGIYNFVDETDSLDQEWIVDNNVFDGGYLWDSCGIYIDSAGYITDLRNVKLRNLIITAMYLGISLECGYFYDPYLENLFYYHSYYWSNFIPLNPVNCQGLEENPFVIPNDPDGWQYYINPDSPVAKVDLGYELSQKFPEQLLLSSFEDGQPRCNFRGIGVGLPIASGVQSIQYTRSDLDKNGRVDLEDFFTLSEQWGVCSLLNLPNYPDSSGFSIADFDKGGFVNLEDLSLLASEWMKVQNPNDPNTFLQYNIGGDPNVVDFEDLVIFSEDWLTVFNKKNPFGLIPQDQNQDGVVDVQDLGIFAENWLQEFSPNIIEDANSVTVICEPIPDLDILKYLIFLDDEYMGMRDAENPLLKISKMKFSNGLHTLKLVICTLDGSTYLVQKDLAPFDVKLSEFSFPEVFDPSNILVFRGKVNPGGSASVQIKDVFGEEILWSKTYGEGNFAEVIDSNSLTDSMVYCLSPSFGSSSALTSANYSVFAAGGRSKPIYKVAGLVMTMYEPSMRQGTVEDSGVARFAYKMLKQKGVIPGLLKGYNEHNDVREEIIQQLNAKYPLIYYAVFVGHSHYKVDGAGILGLDVYRSAYGTNDGKTVSYNSRVWIKRDLAVPENYVWLSESLERAHNLDDWRFYNCRIFMTISCYSLRIPATMDDNWVIDYHPEAYDYEVKQHLNAHPDYPYSDICFPLRMAGPKSVVLGWSNPVVTNNAVYPGVTKLSNFIWLYMCDYNKTIQEAIDETLPIAIEEARKSFRIRGIGLPNNIKVSTDINQ